MKIRTRLISNSSSSSFLLAYNAKDFAKCPTCGLGAKTPLEVVDEESNFNGGETRVISNSIESYLQRRNRELERCRDELAKLQARNPNETLWYDYTVAQAIKSAQLEIAEIQHASEESKRIAAKHDYFIDVDVSHHGAAYNYIQELIEAKKVTLVRFDS